MKLRNIGLAILAAAAVSPSIAGASPSRSSYSACANAFATRLGSAGQQVPKYELVYRNTYDTDVVSQYYATGFTFDLNARDRKTGAPIASATCRTDLHGVVTSLDVKPVGVKRLTANVARPVERL